MIFSNNLTGKIKTKKTDIVRVNLAWVNFQQARQILKKRKNVFLDYPSGRTKPPKPTITFKQAIDLANEFNVKYFAVSNLESVEKIKELKAKVKSEIVPKIETTEGVKNIAKIAKEVKTIMLDKDDLWVDCKGKNFSRMVKKVRSCKIKVFELAGVIFI